MHTPPVPWSIHVQRVVLRAIGLVVIRTVYRSKTAHLERLPATGGVLLLPNHVTFADAFFISAACPRPVRFVMDDAVLKNPAVRWFCSIFHTINIRRGQSREALRLTVEAVQQGGVVCYFAEGQLTRTGALNPLKRGVELIANQIDSPALPLWIDGAWGSIFSFERNLFFRKQPHRLPHRQFASFGEPLAPSDLTVQALRDRLLRAAASAIALRFSGIEDPVEINGYQIGQLNSLPWRRPFAFLSSDPLCGRLPSLFEGFSQQFGCLPVPHDRFDSRLTIWVGGDATRRALKENIPSAPLDFYDFGENALEPLEIENVRHFACLSIDGLVISMSVPDPTTPPNAGYQPGSKLGTWGLMLPGWFIEHGVMKGPAAPEGLALPPGTTTDAGGFLTPPHVGIIPQTVP